MQASTSLVVDRTSGSLNIGTGFSLQKTSTDVPLSIRNDSSERCVKHVDLTPIMPSWLSIIGL